MNAWAPAKFAARDILAALRMNKHAWPGPRSSVGSAKPSVYFLIRSLERGGAERQLIELARGLASRGHRVTVATLYAGGALRGELAAVDNLSLRSFGKSGRWDGRFLTDLLRDVSSTRPDIVHGYMSPANEMAVLLAKLVGAKSVVGLRASNVDFSQYDHFSRMLFGVGALASRFADAIVANSVAGRDHHVQHGYSAARMRVIPNGIDCERFKPNADARAALRTEWGIAEGDMLFGIVGRLDPMKDHANFLRAIASRPFEHVTFVCVGGGSDSLKASMVALARQLDIDSRVLWTGARDDMAAVYNALDVLVLPSAFGEGFPNAVGEAMATARPCIVTDVGDAGVVVGDAGLVVPPQNHIALAEAMSALAHLGPAELEAMGARARERIVAHFSTGLLVDSTLALFEDLVGGVWERMRAPAPESSSNRAIE